VQSYEKIANFGSSFQKIFPLAASLITQINSRIHNLLVFSGLQFDANYTAIQRKLASNSARTTMQFGTNCKAIAAELLTVSVSGRLTTYLILVNWVLRIINKSKTIATI